MSTADKIRNNIIDELLTISNEEYLSALYKILKDSSKKDDQVELTEAQRIMLNMSEDDIKHRRLIPQDEADKADLEWLKGL